MSRIADERVAEVWERLALEARDAGYSVNPDDAFARDLVRVCWRTSHAMNIAPAPAAWHQE